MSSLILPRRLREGRTLARPWHQRGFIINPYRYNDGNDPSFSSVVSLVHCDGANGSTTFTDQKAITWTTVSPAQISTAQSKFGGSSGLFTVSTFSAIQAPASSGWNFGTGAFTIEFQVYFVGTTRCYIFDIDSNLAAFIITPSSGLIEIYGPGSYVINSGSTPFNTGQWYALRLVRVGNTWNVLRDGVVYVTATDSRSWGSSTQVLSVGAFYNGDTITLDGYLDEWRVTKGVARDSGGAYTPQTAPFPNS